MVNGVETAEIILWGERVGAVTWLQDSEKGVFEFAPEFLKRDLDISPIHMPLSIVRNMKEPIFEFPFLNKESYKGLPGLLADALPDKFGNAVIDAWLARQQRLPSSFSPVERLCYTGTRGMGALEFLPSINGRKEQAVPVEVSELTRLVQSIMHRRSSLDVNLGSGEQADAEALLDILRVGTSAGGARPKAIIAMDEAGNVRSGQATAPKNFDYWLLKFDGVDDIELGEPKGYGRIEYAYYLMAKAAGIEMAACRLLEEGGRAHFLTKRFDRVNGEKRHMQSLCGMAHYDFNMAGAYGYEQVFEVMRKLRLSKPEAVQQYRRMVFNVLSRNQDDHTKNISFLLTKDGGWKLSPAFDMTYAHNPKGQWTSQHQMTVNGKRDNFTVTDVVGVGESINIRDPMLVIEEVSEAISRWSEFAKEAGVTLEQEKEIKNSQRKIKKTEIL